MGLKNLMVYRAGGTWFGSEVEWARSGSGWYRQTTGVPIPQSRAEIERFAAENGYKLEWLDPIDGEAVEGTATAPGANAAAAATP
jgi:hypothetical protein